MVEILGTGRKLDAYDIKTVRDLTGLALNTVYIHVRGKNKETGEPNFPNMFKLGRRKLIPRKDFIAYYGFDPEEQEQEEEKQNSK